MSESLGSLVLSKAQELLFGKLKERIGNTLQNHAETKQLDEYYDSVFGEITASIPDEWEQEQLLDYVVKFSPIQVDQHYSMFSDEMRDAFIAAFYAHSSLHYRSEGIEKSLRKYLDALEKYLSFELKDKLFFEKLEGLSSGQKRIENSMQEVLRRLPDSTSANSNSSKESLPIGEIRNSADIDHSERESHVILQQASNDKNQVYRLVVERDGTRICLDPSSVDSLKRIYRVFQEKKRHPVSVELLIKNYDDLSVLREREDLRKSYGDDFAKSEASQMVQKKYRANKEVFKTAIEYMLQDEMLDSCALSLRQKYIDQYGVGACCYYDEYGIANEYWTVFLWIEIVEEMVKELILDRCSEYADDRGLTEIDCCARTRQGKDLWYFISYVSNENGDEKATDMLRHLRWAGCDYLDIPRSDLVAHLYPDFFFNIGLLKQHNEERYNELTQNHAWVFNLYYYTFGLH